MKTVADFVIGKLVTVQWEDSGADWYWYRCHALDNGMVVLEPVDEPEPAPKCKGHGGPFVTSLSNIMEIRVGLERRKNW